MDALYVGWGKADFNRILAGVASRVGLSFAQAGGRPAQMLNRLHIALLVVLVLTGRAGLAADAGDSALAADSAFASLSAERGEQVAFEEYLAYDAIVFRPSAVLAREWFATHEQGAGRLEWTPEAVAVDCSGRWAVSSGPWTYVNPEGGDTASGHYLSIWRREPDNRWRVVLDTGIDHRPRVDSVVQLAASFAALWPGLTATAGRGDDQATTLEDAELSLNEAIHMDGTAVALSHAAAAGALAYRDDAAPAPIATSATADDVYGRGSEARSQFAIADAGSDFGYSYGVIEARSDPAMSPVRAAYVRLWRRDDRQWRLAIDLRSPLPADAGP
jgi:ketosteroid isomerase-like protein